MIIGIGTDMVQKSRIAALLARFGERFIDRILSTEEKSKFTELGSNPAFIAKRFAAKEAVAKALGTGIGETLRFTDISVTNFSNGKPKVALVNKAQALGEDIHIMISLTDEKEYALAFVVITRVGACQSGEPTYS